MGSAAVLLLTYAEWFFGAYERSAIYPLDAERTAPIAGMVEIIVTAEDGTELVTWQAKARAGQPTILYLPGNAGNLAARSGRFADLIGAGYGLVALSWRSSGGSGGTPDEDSLSRDALLVRDSLCPDCVVYGESLGAAVAVKLAASRDLPKVVLESPFTSIDDLARIQFPGDDLSHLITQHWRSIDRAPLIEEPLLVLHSRSDALVPFAQGEAIFAAAASPDKTFLAFSDLGHQDLWGEQLRAGLDAFLAR